MNKLFFIPLMFSLVLTVPQVSTTCTVHATEVTPRPLGNDLPVYSPPEKDQSVTTSIPGPTDELAEEITLNQALSLALMHNPELAASTWDVRTGEARIIQAGLFPNPVVDVEVENF